MHVTCEAGKKICANATVSSDRNCTECDIGRFSSKSNTFFCTVCPSGKFQTLAGAPYCEPNPPGQALEVQTTQETTLALSGITVATFSKSIQLAFRQKIATQLGVDVQLVQLRDISASTRRRLLLNYRVTFTIVLTSSSSGSVLAVPADLTNRFAALVQSNTVIAEFVQEAYTQVAVADSLSLHWQSIAVPVVNVISVSAVTTAVHTVAISCPAGKFSTVGTCATCPTGQFQNNRGSLFCTPVGAKNYLRVVNASYAVEVACPQISSVREASCGSGTLQLNDGFWLDGLTPKTNSTPEHAADWQLAAGYFPGQNTKFYRCMCKGCCKASVVPNELNCADGSRGLLCDSCKKDFYKHVDRTCKPCTVGDDSAWKVALALTVILIVARVGWQRIRWTFFQERHRLVFTKMHGVYVNTARTKLKLLIGFFQVIVLIGEVYDVEYPQVYADFLGGLNIFTADIFRWLNLQCVLQYNYHAVLSIAAALSAISIVSASVALVLTRSPRISTKVIGFINKCSSRRILCSKSGAALSVSAVAVAEPLTIFIYLVYPGFSNQFFRAFNCNKIFGSEYLAADLSINCDESDHKSIGSVSAALICFWTIGVPVLLACACTPAKSATQALNSQTTFSFFTGDYVRRCWYFEAIECMKKVLLTGFAAVFLRGSILQLAVALLAVVVYLVLLLSLQPYSSGSDNVLALLTHTLLGFTLFCSLLTKIASISSAAYADTVASDMQGYNVATTGKWLVVAAALVILLCVAAMIWGIKQEAEESGWFDSCQATVRIKAARATVAPEAPKSKPPPNQASGTIAGGHERKASLKAEQDPNDSWQTSTGPPLSAGAGYELPPLAAAAAPAPAPAATSGMPTRASATCSDGGDGGGIVKLASNPTQLTRREIDETAAAASAKMANLLITPGASSPARSRASWGVKLPLPKISGAKVQETEWSVPRVDGRVSAVEPDSDAMPHVSRRASAIDDEALMSAVDTDGLDCSVVLDGEEEEEDTTEL
jgi:hypothetical protein